MVQNFICMDNFNWMTLDVFSYLDILFKDGVQVIQRHRVLQKQWKISWKSDRRYMANFSEINQQWFLFFRYFKRHAPTLGCKILLIMFFFGSVKDMKNSQRIMIKSMLIHEFQHKSTRVNTNQHESKNKSKLVLHESAPVNTSPTWVSTSPTRVTKVSHD